MIYLLEDDDSIRNFVEYALKGNGLETIGFAKPSDFWEAMDKRIPDLLLLDIMLPEEDGMEILKKIRKHAETADLPVIMLTAKGTEYDKVLGLDSGADDYIVKPFGMLELISRIKALMRRASSNTSNDEFNVDGLYVCISKHIARVNGKDVVLTFKEFELLTLLISNRGAVFTRNQILQNIWGFDFDGESRTVDVHIRTLRTKLGECGDLIETVRGIGYKIGGQ